MSAFTTDDEVADEFTIAYNMQLKSANRHVVKLRMPSELAVILGMLAVGKYLERSRYCIMDAMLYN